MIAFLDASALIYLIEGKEPFARRVRRRLAEPPAPCYWAPANLYILTTIANTPRKPPVVFPQEQRLLFDLGQRLRLARKRHKLINAVVAQRAGISSGLS